MTGLSRSKNHMNMVSVCTLSIWQTIGVGDYSKKQIHIRRSSAVLCLLLWLAASASAQAPHSGDLKCKTVSDTILRKRTLVLRDPFSPKQALMQLFPGKWYDLSQPEFANRLISWRCPRCTPKIYQDVNEMDTLRFPYPDGVATRL